MGQVDDFLDGKGTLGGAGSIDDFLGPEEPKSNPLRRFVADPLISGVKGTIGVPEAAVGLADMVSGGRAGKFLEDEVGFKPKEARNILNEMYSPEQRAANEYVQQGDGFFDTIGRAIEKPSTIGHAVVEALPLSAGGGLVGRGLVKAAGVAPWVAGAVGEGVVGAGSAAEQIRQDTEGGLTTPEQNAMAGLSGVGTGAFGAVGAKFAGSKLGQKLGIADIEASIAGGSVGQPASKGITGLAKRMAGGAVSEGIVEEGPQSAWEQAMQNLATGKPWFEGVGNATAMGILTGGAMGAAFNALPRSEPAAPPPDENPMTRIAGLLPAPVPTGVSGADVVGIDTANQASMDKAEANAAKIYAERDAYEKTMRTVFPFGMPTITTPLQPIQEQINALTGVNASPALSGMEKINYQQQLKKLLDMPVGITNDANGLEIPLTMGDLLESQAQAEEILRAKATGGIEPVPVVGPISAAANTAIATGAADAAQPDAPPPAYPTGSQRQQVNYGDGGTGEIIIEHAEDGSFSVTSVWDKGSANKSTGGTYPAGTDVNVAVDSLVRKHGGYSPAPGKAEDAPAPNTPPATAPRSPEPENAPVPAPQAGAPTGGTITGGPEAQPPATPPTTPPSPPPAPPSGKPKPPAENEAVYRPLIEKLIRNKRYAWEAGFDIDKAIAAAVKAMNGEKQMPGLFRKLANTAEKKGAKDIAEILRQIGDLNDGRKAEKPGPGTIPGDSPGVPPGKPGKPGNTGPGTIPGDSPEIPQGNPEPPTDVPPVTIPEDVPEPEVEAEAPAPEEPPATPGEPPTITGEANEPEPTPPATTGESQAPEEGSAGEVRPDEVTGVRRKGNLGPWTGEEIASGEVGTREFQVVTDLLWTLGRRATMYEEGTDHVFHVEQADKLLAERDEMLGLALPGLARAPLSPDFVVQPFRADYGSGEESEYESHDFTATLGGAEIPIVAVKIGPEDTLYGMGPLVLQEVRLRDNANYAGKKDQSDLYGFMVDDGNYIVTDFIDAVDRAHAELVRMNAVGEITAGSPQPPTAPGGPTEPKAPKEPKPPKEKPTAATPVTAAAARKAWNKYLLTLPPEERQTLTGGEQKVLAGVIHQIGPENAWQYHFLRVEDGTVKVHIGFASESAEADLASNGDAMQRMIDDSDGAGIAKAVYGDLREALPEDYPIVMAEDRLIRLPVLMGERKGIEDALKKLKFRITDRSAETAEADRVVISAIYKPDAVSIGDTGVMGGGRKEINKPDVPPATASEKEVNEFLEKLHKKNFLDPNANAEQTFGNMMYKEGIFHHVISPLDFIVRLLRDTHYEFKYGEASPLNPKKKIEYAIKSTDPKIRETMERSAALYMERLILLNATLTPAKNVGESLSAMYNTYLDRATGQNSALGTELNRVIDYDGTRTQLQRMIDKLADLFQANEEETDQTHRFVKKDPDVPPRLENIIRVGMKDHRGGKNVNEDDFKAAFGFRDVEFGNWVNQIERQENLNLSFDSLHDMADLLGINPSLIGENKILGLAIGSRGKGGRAAAHYEPDNKVINLTKTKGNGTVGHEWSHSLDDIIGSMVKASDVANKAITALKSSLKQRYFPERVSRQLRSILKNAADSKGRNTPPKEAIFDAIKRDRYSSEPSMYYLMRDETKFYIDAKKMDEGPGEKYWSKHQELWARAYETFLYDKSKGGTPYLVGPSRADKYMTAQNGYSGTPYPIGEERKYVGDLFQQFFDNLDKETLEPIPVAVEPKMYEVEGLGFAVLDQFGRDLTTLNPGTEAAPGGRIQNAALQFNKKEVAEATMARVAGMTAYHDVEFAQQGAVNLEMVKFATNIDAIMEEMGIFKWPEVKDGSMAESMFFHLRQGWWPKDNVELKQYIAQAFRIEPKEVDRIKIKQGQEDFEAALGRYAGQKVVDMRATGANEKAIYDYLVDLYQKQPNLNIRTSTSVANQAYSTPVTISFIAGLLGRVRPNDTVFDPTGGNGLLLMTANPKKSVAIEMDPHRAANMKLMQIGRVIEGDALQVIDSDINPEDADVVLTNPPFGQLETAGAVKSWTGVDYWMGKLDHLIAAKSLKAMANRGRAVIILGANKTEGMVQKADRVFLNWLYSNYNVADHFEIDGGLYARMGAEWPLRVLVVAGRKETESAYEPAPIDRVMNFEQLWGRYEQALRNSESVVVGAGKPSQNPGGPDKPPTGLPGGDQGKNTGTGGKGGPGGIPGPDETGNGGRGPGNGGDSGGTNGSPDGENGRGRNDPGGQPGEVGTGPEDGGGSGGQGSGGGKPGGLDGLTPADIEKLLTEGFGDAPSETPDADGWVDADGNPVPKPKKRSKGGGGGGGGGKTKSSPKSGPAKPSVLDGIPGIDSIFGDLDNLLRKDPDSGILSSKSASSSNRGAPTLISVGEQFDESLFGTIRPFLNKLWDVIGANTPNAEQQIVKFAQGLRERYDRNILPYAMAFIKERQAEDAAIPTKKKEVIVSNDVDNEVQVAYRARSSGDSSGVRVPKNQAKEIQSALDAVEDENGDIDEFVKNELGYESVQVMHDGFAEQKGQHKGLGGYQVDALALAIAAVKENSGFIIGDDTGVGKGRTAAAVIAWAVKNGKVPIFFTMNPELYSAMVDDLDDINQSVKVGVTNSDTVIIKRKDKSVAYNFKTGDGTRMVKHIIATGNMPDTANAIFTSYSQVNMANDRRVAIERLVKEGKAVIVMDEAHNSAGESQTNEFFMRMLTGEGLFGKDSVGNIDPPEGWQPPGTVYLSATFAKRPANMPVYIRTHLRHAANTAQDIVNLFSSGGAVLQEIASSMLTEAGSMIRRERSYAGVKFNFKVDETHAARDARAVDQITEVLRSIVRADRQFAAWVKTPDGDAVIRTLVPPGWAASMGGTNADVAMNKNLFTSVVHNYISQLLLATKVETAVEDATASIERGEKVVITMQNTMEAMLTDYVNNEGIKVGDEMPGFGWQSVLARGVKSARRVTFSSPNRSPGAPKRAGDTIRVIVPENLIPPLIRAEFERATQLIADIRSDLAASPISALRNRLAQYSVTETKAADGTVSYKVTKGNTPGSRPLVTTEITGRKSAVDYSGPVPRLMARDDPDKIDIIQAFQGGSIDIALLNSSGSTGISLHADSWAADQRPRHMIILQPNPDITIFKQIIGRIHRTGQVEWPQFTVLATAIPAERRLLAMLKKKLGALFANTSSGKGAIDIDAVDFINLYGDEVVADYLNDNQDAADFIGIRIPTDPSGSDISLTASGRAALLSVDEQKDFFDTVEEQYKQKIQILDDTGRNILNRRSLNLEAVPISEEIIEMGMDESNPFTRTAYLGKYKVNVIGNTPTAQVIKDSVANVLNGRTTNEVVDALEASVKTDYDEAYNQLVLRLQSLDADLSNPAITPAETQALTDRRAAVELKIQRFGQVREDALDVLRSVYRVGSGFGTFTVGDVVSAGIVTGVTINKPKSKTGNPFTPSNVIVHIARNIPGGASRGWPLSALNAASEVVADRGSWMSRPDIDDLFAMGGVAGKEERYILTGNILRARANIQGGEIIQFTDANGKLHPGGGILMPATWQYTASQRDSTAIRYPASAADYLLNMVHQITTERWQDTGYDNYKESADAAAAERKFAVTIPDASVDYYNRTRNALYGPGQSFYITLNGLRGDMQLGIDASLPRLVKSKAISALVGGDLSKRRGAKYYESPRFSDPKIIRPLLDLIAKNSTLQAPILFEPEINTLNKLYFDENNQKKPKPTPSAPNRANDGRITPSDKAVYGLVAEGKDIKTVLKFIAESSRNPFYRQLAKLLMQAGVAPAIKATSSKGWKFDAGDGKYAAAYNNSTNTIALFRPAASERNVLHEMMHAATMSAMKKNGMAAAAMRKLFEHVKATGKVKGQYGITNVDEFIAEAFSNPKFQAALKTIEANGASGIKSAWHWFIRVVRGILGLKNSDDNALSAALEIGLGVMRENMGARNESRKPPEGAKLAALRSTAAALERPNDGVFLRVDDEGKAITSVPKGARIPEAFRIFAVTNGLDFYAERRVPKPSNTAIGEGRTLANAVTGDITRKSEPMPEIYRVSGAHYFGEDTGQSLDRTGNTRYNIASDWYDKTVPDTAKTMVANALTSDSSTSWVNALNTQYHKAQRWAAEGKPWFKQVFDLGQKFLSDTSRLSVVAQDAAPNLFREVKSLGDVKKAISGMKSLGDLTGSTHAKNIDAVANPLYEGTLDGGGNPMKGKVFSDDELISTYHLNDTQIKLYREALKAVGVSLDEMAKSIIAKHAKNLGLPFDNAMSLTDMAKDVAEQVESLRLEAENKKDVQAEKRLKKTLADVKGTASKTAMLKRAGYFPLMRFGKHTVTAIDDAGEVQFFSMYDGIPLVPNSGQYQANKVAAELRATNPEWKVTTGINNDEKYKLYAGMSVDSLQLFAEHMDAESLEPYQEYLRQATNNRSVMKRLIHRKGTPGFDRDVRRTLAQFIISNARAASSSYHLYDMRKAAESVPNEYGDIGKEAVRLFKYVSDPVEEAQGLRGFLFFNFLGGSLASAMVNMTQIPMVAFPFLSQYQDAAALGTTLAGAAKMAVKNPKNVQGPLGDALRRAEQDGVTAPQEIYQLAGVASGSALSGNRGFNLLLKTWGAPFALAEAFNRRTTFIAAYQIAEKMTPEQLRKAGAASAFEFAESAVTQTQFIYNKGNRPNAGRGAVGATLMTFKQFSIMYLELLNRLPRKQQLIMIGVLLLAAGGGGLPFAEDIEDLIDTIGQWLGYATNTKRALRNTLSSVIGERAADVAINGVASQMGIDIHSRIGLQNLAPGSAALKKSSVNKGQDIQEFFGPAGSVVKSVGAALEALATGKPGQAALAMAPNAAQNAIRGARMIASGYAEDAGGRRTIPVSPAEGAAKAIGFNPKSVADFGTVKRDISQNQRLIQVKREEFTSAMVDAILSGDNEARKQAMVDMMQWNRDNDPSMRVIVDQAAVLRRVQQARMDGISRFTKTVSKPMRESARQELMR